MNKLKIFLKKYILTTLIVLIVYSLLELFISKYHSYNYTFFTSDLSLLLLIFIGLRFYDDYEDFYLDKLKGKNVFHKYAYAVFTLLCLFISLFLICYFKKPFYLLPIIFIMLGSIDALDFLKMFILPSAVGCSYYYLSNKIEYPFFIIVEGFLVLSVVFYVFKLSMKKKFYSLEEAGGKAYNLNQLDIKNTPKYFLIPVEYLFPFDETKIKLAIKAYANPKKLYAVRSSAVDEDSKNHSFAGIHDTYLNVKYDEIFDNIKKVLESATSERAILYRNQNGLDVSDIKIAVLIQEMVNADFAGVINSINPITNNISEVVVSVTKGLGDKLVDGSVDGSTYYLNGDDYKVIGEDILNKKQIKNILELVDDIKKKTNHFQDIEFAIKKNKVYFLQSRDITTYKDINTHELSLIIDNSNIIESYYGVTSPLTISFAKEIYTKVYTETFKLGKVRKSIMDSLKPSLENMLYDYEGKIYYNLNSWYHTNSIFPSKKSSKYMEAMMGVKTSNSDFKRVKLNIFDMIKIGVIFLNKLKNIDKDSNAFIDEFNKVVLPYYGIELNMTTSELISLYNEIDKKIIKEFTTPIINDCGVMFYFGKIKEEVKKYPNSSELLANLVNNNGNVESARSATEFRSIINLIKENIDYLDDFKSLSEEELFNKYHNESTELGKLILTYVYNFGSRVGNELKLETITMIENPLMIYSLIIEALNNKEEISLKESQIEIPTKLLRKANKARHFIQNRERLRLKRTYVFSVVRNIFLGIGRNLVKENKIDQVSDIFYLTKDEIFNGLEDYRSVINKRKEEEIYYQSCKVYDRVIFYNDKVLPVLLSNGYKGDICGIPSGTGVITHKVTVMESSTDPFTPGDIIVCKRTDPGWISLFSMASGIVVEHGSMLSHSFVVARELGLPAVVGVANVTSILKTGDVITLDSLKGVITLETK